jgi:hypothetical protein
MGYRYPDEARLETFGPMALPGHDVWNRLLPWWLVHPKGANTPNWDLALSCEIDGRPGLVLFEAKAHHAELSDAGKKPLDKASARSLDNLRQISTALHEAADGYRQEGFSPVLTTESHYQAANRLAFAWKLASSGIPTVLVYLGFIGDTGIRDVGRPFDSADEWDRHCRTHLAEIRAGDMLDRPIVFGDAPLRILVRSRHCRVPSPSA